MLPLPWCCPSFSLGSQPAARAAHRGTPSRCAGVNSWAGVGCGGFPSKLATQTKAELLFGSDLKQHRHRCVTNVINMLVPPLQGEIQYRESKDLYLTHKTELLQ